MTELRDAKMQISLDGFSEILPSEEQNDRENMHRDRPAGLAPTDTPTNEHLADKIQKE